MPGIVRILPSGREFPVDGNDPILEAALQAGLSLNYGCSNGNCGLCQARLVTGEVKKIRHHDFTISEADKVMGHMLLCSYTALGDIVIEAPEETMIPQQNITAKVKKITSLTDDIVLLHLQTPRTQRLRFLAGQSAALAVNSGVAGEYPIASCPCDDRNIQFHIRLNSDHAFTRHIQEMRPNDTLEVIGPNGDFVLNEQSHRPLMLLAYDTGFAPLKSLIEHAMQLERSQPLYLYWIACAKGDHYMHNLVRSWTDVFDNFFYTPLAVTEPNRPMSSTFGCREDLLNELLKKIPKDHQNLHEYDFYVAGPEPMPQLARNLFLNHQVPQQQIRSCITH